jgi:hypothetical protein
MVRLSEIADGELIDKQAEELLYFENSALLW